MIFKLSPPEPIPFPTPQTERKTSPHYGQRSTSNTGPLRSKSSGKSMPFNLSPYSSDYLSPYNTSKTSGLNGSGYPSHTASSGQGIQHLSNSAGSGSTSSGGGSSHESSAFQSYHQPGSYNANQTPITGSLYQVSSAQSTGVYNSQSNCNAPAPGSYQNQSTDASSSSSFPTAPVSSYSSSSIYQRTVNGGNQQESSSINSSGGVSFPC